MEKRKENSLWPFNKYMQIIHIIINNKKNMSSQILQKRVFK